MSDLKHLKHEITLLYQQGGFTEAKLDVRTIHALIACAEALQQLVTDYGDVPYDNGDVDGQQVMTDASAALAALEAAP
jgi:hypothetical protein